MTRRLPYPEYRPAPGEIPTDPGVYRFRDPAGRVVYVGKAKNLRARLSSYFRGLENLHPRTQAMVTTASSVQWTVVSNEIEALQLEYTWIKHYRPRFNVQFRDDKSYPYLAVTMSDAVPRVQVMRGERRPGTRYFGPYTQVWAIRETVDLLLRVFPVRTCSRAVFRRAERSGRPCLLGYIDKCSAPCVGRIGLADHRRLAENFCRFMAGDAAAFLGPLEDEMASASAALEFERAAKLRDDIAALRKALEKSAVVLDESADLDVFGLAEDELEAAVQVFFVRGGRIRGQRGWIVEKVEETTPGQLMEQLLAQVYGEIGTAEADAPPGPRAPGEGEVPREVLLPALPDDLPRIAEWLRALRGSNVDVRVPRRGDKRDLASTVAKNADQALRLHKMRRSGDLTTRSEGLRQIQDALGLEQAPLRIEGYDNSHMQGTNVVGSMVVFEDGLARKSEYRRFIVSGEGARDDTASMYDVLTRRFRRYVEERSESSEPELDGPPEDGPGTGPGAGPANGEVPAGAPADRPGRFAYPPNLLVIDGGPPQVAAARRALDDLGIEEVAICGLAKRLEEVWLPGEEFPVILPRNSEGLYLLQRVRDESHRFAITFHRQRRSKAMTRSALDGVPGLGPARQKALLRQFGSVARLRHATAEEIAAVRGIGPAVAQAVVDHLAGETPAAPAVDTATGEILED